MDADASHQRSGHIPTVQSKVNPNHDLGTGFGFRGWQYATAQVSLAENGTPGNVCLDTGAGVTLIDAEFFKTQSQGKVAVRTMATPITVRGLGANRHSTDKYAITPLYFLGENADGASSRALITREIHLVDNLKANMLIGNDILGPEAIDILISSNTAHIGSCGITIPITIRTRSALQTRPINSIRAMTLPPHSDVIIPVHSIKSMPDRDYLFEPISNATFSLFAHTVSVDTKGILARNNSDKVVEIPRNFRLGHVTEIYYSEAFHADPDIADLAIRAPRSEHKTSWFKKLLVACAAAQAAIHSPFANAANVVSSQLSTSEITPPPIEIILSNGVTIHNSSKEAIDGFSNLVGEYFKVFQDQGFANLSEDHWMKIPLKSGWEEKVKEKAKVYPLGSKDKALVDQTFDELHRQGKMSWTTQSTPFSYPCFFVYRGPPEKRKGRVVVDIRALNAITQPDAYFLPLQSDIIQAVQDALTYPSSTAPAFFTNGGSIPATVTSSQ